MRLGEILVEQGSISEDMLAQALDEQQKDGSRLGSTLVKLGFLKEENLLSALSKHFGVKSVDIKKMEIKELEYGQIAKVQIEVDDYTGERYLISVHKLILRL